MLYIQKYAVSRNMLAKKNLADKDVWILLKILKIS